MAVVILLVTYADGHTTPVDGQYLVDYDPTWLDIGEYGLLIKTLKTSPDIADAKRFDDAGAAFECWRMVSPNNPMRPDGKPNRPLTAFTVELVTVEMDD